MIPGDNNDLNGNKKPLRSDRQSRDRLQNTSNSNAAAENRSNSQSPEKDENPEYRENPENAVPLSTQGDIEELEEDMSGTTNLSPEQLDKDINQDRWDQRDRLQDTSYGKTTTDNRSDSQRIQEAGRAAEPAYQLDLDRDENPENRRNPENAVPLNTQGSIEKLEEDMSGTTNLSPEQLEKDVNKDRDQGIDR